MGIVRSRASKNTKVEIEKKPAQIIEEVEEEPDGEPDPGDQN